jgi:hypothetical protein
MSPILPQLQMIWKHDKMQKTFSSIFQAENFEKIMWNVLYLVMGYIATVIILMKSVPAIARKFGELEDDALAEPEEDDSAVVAGTAATAATTAPGTGGTATSTATTPAKKTEEKSGRWIAWVGGTVLLLVILSTLMNSGTPSKKDDSKKDDSVSKTDDRPKHAEKKKSELDEDFANTLRRNGERDPENLSVDLTEEETASEEGERFGE